MFLHQVVDLVFGMVSSTVLTLAVIPAIYAPVKQWRLKRGGHGARSRHRNQRVMLFS